MPRKYKKQSKKRVYKKRKSTPKKNKITAKNKNIIKVNVSTGGGGGSSGSSVIPIPYPANISSGMNPIPVNIYNTLGRNPYEPNYETLKLNQEIQSQEPVKIQTPIQPEPIPIPIPLSTPKKIDFSKTPQFAFGLIDELKKKQEERALKKMQQPAIPLIEPIKKEPIPTPIKTLFPMPNPPSLEDFFRDNPITESKKVGKPVSNKDEILSPIRNYEYNPNVSLNEQAIRNHLKNEGKTNAQIGQLIFHMKKRGEL